MRRIYYYLLIIWALLLCIPWGAKSQGIGEKQDVRSDQRIFVRSYPAVRPEWADDNTKCDVNKLCFTGVSLYHSTDQDARGDARENARSQILDYVSGKLLKIESKKNTSSYGYSGGTINPYIEQEEQIKSFAQGIVNEVASDNY